MQYSVGETVLFDGGPANIIGVDLEDRSYLIEFTGATGRRTKTVFDRDLEDASDAWNLFTDLQQENRHLQERITELEIALDNERNARILWQEETHKLRGGHDSIPF